MHGSPNVLLGATAEGPPSLAATRLYSSWMPPLSSSWSKSTRLARNNASLRGHPSHLYTRSSDTYVYELRRRPDLRGCASSTYCEYPAASTGFRVLRAVSPAGASAAPARAQATATVLIAPLKRLVLVVDVAMYRLCQARPSNGPRGLCADRSPRETPFAAPASDKAAKDNLKPERWQGLRVPHQSGH